MDPRDALRRLGGWLIGRFGRDHIVDQADQVAGRFEGLVRRARSR